MRKSRGEQEEGGKPGEQAQVDWGCFGSIQIGQAKRLLSCFVMVLSFSRALFARFVLDQTLESFLRCHLVFRGRFREALTSSVHRLPRVHVVDRELSVGIVLRNFLAAALDIVEERLD